MPDKYINSTGSGSGAGTILDPYKTIAELNAATIALGETAFFNRGDTFSDVALTADVNATYDDYGTGSKPIIDGELTLVDGIIINVANVTINDLDVRNCVTRNIRGQSGSDNLAMNGVAVSGGTGSGMFLQGDGDGSLTDCTITHNDAGSGFYGLNLNPFSAVATTWTLTDVIVQGNGVDTIQFPVYFRKNASADLTVNATGLTVSNANALTAAGVLFTCRTTDGVFTNVDITGCSGKIAIGQGDATNVTFDNLTFPDSTDDAIGLPTAGASLTLKNSTITGAQKGGVACVAAVNVDIQSSTITGNGLSGSGDGVTMQTSGALTVTDSNISNNEDDGIGCSGAVNSTIKTTITNSNGEDGINWIGTGIHYTEGCTSNSNGKPDVGSSGDGFSAHNTCTIQQFGCTASDNLGGGFTHINSTTGYIRNSSAYGNYLRDGAIQGDDVAGFRWQTDQDFEVSNCISMDNDYGFIVDAATAAQTTWTITLDGNCYWSSGLRDNQLRWDGDRTYADWVTQSGETNSINVDPLFVDEANFDLALKIASPCVGTSPRTWAADTPNPVGADGEPYANFDIDKGGLMSKHGPFHPVNL